MIKIIIENIENTNVIAAVNMCNSILTTPEFYAAISEHPSFDLTQTSPKTISALIENSDLEFNVKLFDTAGLKAIKYRKTNAYTDSKSPSTLFLNKDKLDRETAKIAKSIIHEAVHAVDNAEIKHRFGHGKNRSKGKGNTAAYWIGDLAYRMLTKDVNLHAELKKEFIP